MLVAGFRYGSPVRIGHLSEVDVFVTDQLASEPLVALCREHAVRVVEVGTSQDEG